MFWVKRFEINVSIPLLLIEWTLGAYVNGISTNYCVQDDGSVSIAMKGIYQILPRRAFVNTCWVISLSRHAIILKPLNRFTGYRTLRAVLCLV